MEIESLLNSKSPSAQQTPATAPPAHRLSSEKMSKQPTAQPPPDEPHRGYATGHVSYQGAYPYGHSDGLSTAAQATSGQQEPYGHDSLDQPRSRAATPMSQGSARPSANRQHPCKSCGKGFARRSDLVRHERIHSGEKPHTCNHPGCRKQFIQRSALTVHERIHTGTKPHICEICSKPFGDSSSLARHRRTHSGSRPYKCTGCDKTFTRKTTLTRHMASHSVTATSSATEQAAAQEAAVLANRAQATIKDEEESYSTASPPLQPVEQDQSYQAMSGYSHPPQHAGYTAANHYPQSSPEATYGRQGSPSSHTYNHPPPVYMGQQRASVTSHPAGNVAGPDQHHHHPNHSHGQIDDGHARGMVYPMPHSATPPSQHQPPSHPPLVHHPQSPGYNYTYSGQALQGTYPQSMYQQQHAQHPAGPSPHASPTHYLPALSSTSLHHTAHQAVPPQQHNTHHYLAQSQQTNPAPAPPGQQHHQPHHMQTPPRHHANYESHQRGYPY